MMMMIGILLLKSRGIVIVKITRYSYC